MKCDNCGREIVTEGKKKENYFVEGKKGEVVICNTCYYANWHKAEVRKWEKSGSG